MGIHVIPQQLFYCNRRFFVEGTIKAYRNVIQYKSVSVFTNTLNYSDMSLAYVMKQEKLWAIRYAVYLNFRKKTVSISSVE